MNDSMDEMVELILAYVPEAEYLSFDDAVQLALERDGEAADELLHDVAELEPRNVG